MKSWVVDIDLYGMGSVFGRALVVAVEVTLWKRYINRRLDSGLSFCAFILCYYVYYCVYMAVTISLSLRSFAVKLMHMSSFSYMLSLPTSSLQNHSRHSILGHGPRHFPFGVSWYSSHCNPYTGVLAPAPLPDVRRELHFLHGIIPIGSGSGAYHSDRGVFRIVGR
jgi:hypothetical protein